MFSDIPHEEWTSALDAAAEELLWEAGVASPPVDAFYLALELGVTVTEDTTLPARAQFVRLPAGRSEVAQPTIVLGEEDRFDAGSFPSPMSWASSPPCVCSSDWASIHGIQHWAVASSWPTPWPEGYWCPGDGFTSAAWSATGTCRH